MTTDITSAYSSNQYCSVHDMMPLLDAYQEDVMNQLTYNQRTLCWGCWMSRIDDTMVMPIEEAINGSLYGRTVHLHEVCLEGYMARDPWFL